MGAFKGNQGRGQMGYGSAGMGRELTSRPYKEGRVFSRGQDRGTGPYAGADMGQDKIKPAGADIPIGENNEGN